MTSPNDKYGGRWWYDASNGCFFSDDFTHDAALKLTGDFADEHDKTAYAAEILKCLASSAERATNAAPCSCPETTGGLHGSPGPMCISTSHPGCRKRAEQELLMRQSAASSERAPDVLNALRGLHKAVKQLAEHFDKPITDDNVPLWLALNSAQDHAAKVLDAPASATRRSEIADHAEVIGNVTAALLDLNVTYDGNRATFTFESTNNAMAYIQKARRIVEERLELIRRSAHGAERG